MVSRQLLCAGAPAPIVAHTSGGADTAQAAIAAPGAGLMAEDHKALPALARQAGGEGLIFELAIQDLQDLADRTSPPA